MAKKRAEEGTPECVADRLLEEFEEKYGSGVIVGGSDYADEPTQRIHWSPNIDTMLSGAVEEGSFVGITGNEKTGKAQPLGATVYTPAGPRLMGQIREGDWVLTPDGGRGRVAGVYPQGELEFFRLFFSDGSSADCCDEHLWKIRVRGRWKVLPLREVVPLLGVPDDPVRIPTTRPMSFLRRQVQLDPYLAGVYLVSGRGGAKEVTPLASNLKEEVALAVASMLETKGLATPKVSRRRDGFRVEMLRVGGGRSNPVMQKLRAEGISEQPMDRRTIPECYLYNDAEHRFALLQGMLDARGKRNDKGRPCVLAYSEEMSRQIVFLAQSLGMFATVKVVTLGGARNRYRTRYLCRIDYADSAVLFRHSPLKREKLKGRAVMLRKLVRVEPAGRGPAVCIKVDTPDGLYLTDDCVVTHNTTYALSLAAEAQRPEYGSRVVYYDKVEGRLSRVHLKGIQGLDLDPARFRIIQSTEEHILSAQDRLEMLISLMKNTRQCVFIIDSISAYVDDKELTEGVGSESRGGGAKLFSQFVRLVNQVVPVKKHIVVGITHLISNTSGFGATYVERAARMWKYQCDYQLRTMAKEAWMAGDRQIGFKVKWSCTTSKNGPPGGTTESYLRFGVGVDRLFEAISLGTAVGLIGKNGSWMTLDFLKDEFASGNAPKFQGAEKLYQALLDNPEWAAALRVQLQAFSG